MCKYVIAAKLGRRREEFFSSVSADVPEIRNVSHCTSTAKLITCVCIVESNPPSRLQFVLSDRIQNSTGVKTNGTVTTALLQVQQRPYTFVQCLANSTLGRAELILPVQLHHSNGFLIFPHIPHDRRKQDERAICFVIGQAPA